ncbi:nuclear transport factor 2 family protein [Kovacikia minuta]|uniref:nuclear transport factor 2 family protein n=1 Tax=Kovacikia minuta TaxID=2931930 RepID=UPI0026761FCE
MKQTATGCLPQKHKAQPRFSDAIWKQNLPYHPLHFETAKAKVQAAEDAWNTRDPARVALAYTEDSQWRNRAEFFNGREAIRAFLKRKWDQELDYRLKKELWSFTDNRISVRFEYEWHDAAGNWYRSYGNEQWEFAANGLMQRREASINDVPIQESDRKFRWERKPGL